MLQEMTVISNAGFAIRQVRPPAVAIIARDQRDPGTDAGVIMDMNLIGQVQHADQIVNFWRIVSEVVGLQAYRPRGP